MQVEDHVSLDVDFSGFFQDCGGQVQATTEPRGAEVSEDFVQIEMGIKVVAVSVLGVGAIVEVEPSWGADTEAVRREFHQGDIKATAVEGYEGWMGVFFPAEPEVFCDRFGAVKWFVE